MCLPVLKGSIACTLHVLCRECVVPSPDIQTTRQSQSLDFCLALFEFISVKLGYFGIVYALSQFEHHPNTFLPLSIVK